MKSLKTIAMVALAAASILSTHSCKSTEPEASLPMVCAHRGCWLADYIPENSISGVYMAARYGYPAIECDVKYTLDSVMVLMHDKTINRTMRNAHDYSEIAEPVVVTETTFEDLRNNYVLASDDPDERTQIPTLEELLIACKDAGIIPMLHSHVRESYHMAQEMLGDEWVCFNTEDELGLYARGFSNCLVLLDPGKAEASNTVERLAAIGGNCGMSTMKWDMLDAAYIADVKSHGYSVQSSIFVTPHEADAISDGADIILSDFCWLQQAGRKPFCTWRVRRQDLSTGTTLVHEHDEEHEFGALTFSINYKGSIEVLVNGERSYTFTSEEAEDRVIGVRFYKTCPAVQIKALKDSHIEKATLEIYSI